MTGTDQRQEQPITPGRVPERLSSHPVSRRAVVQSMAAVGGAAMLSHRLGSSWVTAAALQEEPRYGGVYRVLTDGDVPSLDAALAFNYVDWWLSYMGLYNRLYVFDTQGQLQPDLADGLPEVTDDGLTYTVKLKPGVTFHNGAEVTAEDVAFSFSRTTGQTWVARASRTSPISSARSKPRMPRSIQGRRWTTAACCLVSRSSIR